MDIVQLLDRLGLMPALPKHQHSASCGHGVAVNGGSRTHVPASLAAYRKARRLRNRAARASRRANR